MMMGRTALSRWLGGLAILLGLALIWWLFAPARLAALLSLS